MLVSVVTELYLLEYNRKLLPKSMLMIMYLSITPFNTSHFIIYYFHYIHLDYCQKEGFQEKYAILIPEP